MGNLPECLLSQQSFFNLMELEMLLRGDAEEKLGGDAGWPVSVALAPPAPLVAGKSVSDLDTSASVTGSGDALVFTRSAMNLFFAAGKSMQCRTTQ